MAIPPLFFALFGLGVGASDGGSAPWMTAPGAAIPGLGLAVGGAQRRAGHPRPFFSASSLVKQALGGPRSHVLGVSFSVPWP